MVDGVGSFEYGCIGPDHVLDGIDEVASVDEVRGFLLFNVIYRFFWKLS